MRTNVRMVWPWTVVQNVRLCRESMWPSTSKVQYPSNRPNLTFSSVFIYLFSPNSYWLYCFWSFSSHLVLFKIYTIQGKDLYFHTEKGCKKIMPSTVKVVCFVYHKKHMAIGKWLICSKLCVSACQSRCLLLFATMTISSITLIKYVMSAMA